MSELKISNELAAIIRDKLKSSSDEEISVIISLSNDAAMEKVKTELIKNGMRIETLIPGPIQVVSGTISVKAISEVAKVSGVKKIENDSKVYAL